MSIIEEMHARASLVYISLKILDGSSIPTSQMDFDKLINAVNSEYDNSIKEVLGKTQIRKASPVINAYTAKLIDIYFSMGVQAGAKLHAELIGFNQKNNHLSRKHMYQEVYMKSVIQEIFQGTLIPSEQFETILDSYKEKAKSLDSLVTSFCNSLSESQQTTFDNIMNTHLGLVRIELEQSFTDGFKTGIRLLHESLDQTENGRFDDGRNEDEKTKETLMK